MTVSKGFCCLVICLTIPRWASVFSVQYVLTFLRVEKLYERKQASKQASRQAGKQAGKQASRKKLVKNRNHEALTRKQPQVNTPNDWCCFVLDTAHTVQAGLGMSWISGPLASTSQV